MSISKNVFTGLLKSPECVNIPFICKQIWEKEVKTIREIAKSNKTQNKINTIQVKDTEQITELQKSVDFIFEKISRIWERQVRKGTKNKRTERQ